MNKGDGLLSRVLWLVCRSCLAGGVGMLLAGCGFVVFQSIWLARSVPSRGTIVELIPVEDQEQNTTNYAPRFTFSGDDGRMHTVTSDTASNPPAFQVGEQVRVRYIRGNPSSAKLDYFWQLWFIPIVFGCLGVLFTPAGYLLLRRERQRLSLPMSV